MEGGEKNKVCSREAQIAKTLIHRAFFYNLSSYECYGLNQRRAQFLAIIDYQNSIHFTSYETGSMAWGQRLDFRFNN